MAAYKMAAVKVTPPNDFPLGLIRSHMVVINLFLMLCDLQRVVSDLCPTLYVLVSLARVIYLHFTDYYFIVGRNTLLCEVFQAACILRACFLVSVLIY